MSDETFQQAKRVIERHGYVLAKPYGLQIDEDTWIDPDLVIKVHIDYEHRVLVTCPSIDTSFDKDFKTREEAEAYAAEVRNTCWGIE